MPRFEREGATSVFNMIGRLEPSRAINPSDGTDPISMGLMPNPGPPAAYVQPGIEGGRPTPATYEAIGPELNDATGLTQPPQGEYPSVDTLRAAIEAAGILPARWINLDSGQAQLDGEIIVLSLSDSQKIMEILIDAFDRGMRERVLSLRMEYLHEEQRAREEVRPTDTEAALVQRVPRESEEAQQEAAKPMPTKILPPVLQAGTKRRRNVRPVQGTSNRVEVPTPEA